MILKIKIGIIFFISIDVLNAQNAKPPDALSSLFGDLLKSAGNLSPSPSSVTKEPSLLHNLVRNVEKQKSEKSKSDHGFQDPMSETKPSKDGFNNNEKTELNLPNKDERVSEKGPSGNKENFKPSKGGEGTNDNDKEEEDRERGPSSGGKDKFKPSKDGEGFENNEKEGGDRERGPSSGGKDKFKPSKEGEGFEDNEKEGGDRERGFDDNDKEEGESEREFSSRPGENGFGFNSNSGLKPVRPPPSIELNDEYGDEEYSDEEEENYDERQVASSSEVFDRPKPILPVAVTPSDRNNSTKKRKLKPKQKQWCPRTKNCDDDDGEENWVNFRDSSPSKLCREAGGETAESTETCIYQRLRPDGRSSLKCGVCRTVFIPRIVGGVDIQNKEKTDKKKQSKTEKLREAGTVSKSKLEWVEVDSSVENCEGEMSSSLKETKTVSPSILCEKTGASQDLRCLCVRKDQKVKHVCGECKISLKLK